MRDLPVGVDQRSPVRHPDFIGADDLRLKIEEIREATDHRVPVYVKLGACRVFDDVRLAAKAGADVIVDRRDGGRHGGVARCSCSTTPASRRWPRSSRRARR